MQVMRVYNRLLKTFGPQHWWPVHPGRKRPGFDPIFEILLGAILTQNTSWRNVERAIDALYRENLLDAKAVTKVRIDKLRRLIRPARYYNQKALKLRVFARSVMDESKGSAARFIRTVSRDDLLMLWGVGPETADSMLLYGGNRAEFVVDAYTKRLCERYGVVFGSYQEYKTFFEERLPREPRVYNEYHALIVRWGQEET